jgi:hypothetical protein
MKVEIERTSHAGTTISTQLAQSANDYSNAAYACLLQFPTTDEAHRLEEALLQLLFPEKKSADVGLLIGTRRNRNPGFVAERHAEAWSYRDCEGNSKRSRGAVEDFEESCINNRWLRSLEEC